MAAEKETVVLDFQVEQGSAIQELERTKRSIITLKQEQQELNKAYKQGNITLDEYASESVRLEGILKKQQSEYNNVQKSVTGVKTQLDKLIDSNKKISQEFAESAKQINVAGVSVGDLSGKLASFANPATAAIGIVTALGAAYTRSSIGAKDLEFAQNQLAAATNILTDRFASLFSSADDGEGFFSKLTNLALKFSIIGITDALGLTNVVEDSRNAALASDQLNAILEDRELILADNNRRLGENAELLTLLTDTTASLAERQEAADKIQQNAKTSSEALIASFKAQKEAILAINEGIEDRGPINKQLNAIDRQIEAEELKATRLQEQATKALSAAKKADAAETARVRKEVEQFLKTIRVFDPERTEKEEAARQEAAEKSAQFLIDLNVDTLSAFQSINERIAEGVEISEEQKREQYKRTYELKRELDQADLDATSLYLQAASILAQTFAGEQSALFKITATAEAIASTYAAANYALRNPPGPPISFATAAVTIAAGLANVARINNIGFAEGGYTGHGGKYQPAGIVHKGEVVWSQHDVALAGGPSRVDRMRPTYPRRSNYSGYADGGIVVDGATGQINTTIATINSLKNLPAPEVSVVEITRKQRRVSVKESNSRLR